MTNAESAVSLFKEGYCCAQSVLATFGPSLGLDKETALKLGTPFGGGFGRLGETCGALIGGYLVIGLKHPRLDASDKAAKERNYVFVQKFTQKFKEKNNDCVTCRDLLKCDKSTEEGRVLDRKLNLTQLNCPKFIADAVEILEEIM